MARSRESPRKRTSKLTPAKARKSRRWGNTNSARAKIRHWAEDEAERSGLPPQKQWRVIEVYQLDDNEVRDLEDRWLKGEVEVSDNVADQFQESNPEIFRYEFDIKWRPETQDDPLIAYNSKEDFLITDLFTARGKQWRQTDRGDHIEGWNADYDYFVFDIETPQMAARFGK